MEEIMEPGNEGKSVGAGITVPPLPGWDLVGRGYNVFGDYASTNSIKHPVFDWKDDDFALVDHIRKGRYLPKLITANRDPQSQSFCVSSKRLEDYLSKQSRHASLEAGYSFFGGSLTRDFDESSRSSTQLWFTKYTHRLILWNLLLDADYLTLRDKMVKSVKTSLDNIFKNGQLNQQKAVEFFKEYGTHFVSGILVGGRIDYTCTTSQSKFSDEIQVTKAAELSFMSKALKIGVDANSADKELRESFEESSTSKCETIGGSVTLGSKINSLYHEKEDYANWANSVEDDLDNATLIDFNSNGLTCFSKLYDNEVQSQELEKFFRVYAREMTKRFGVDGYYINKLTVISGSTDNPNVKAPPGYTRIDYDLNKEAGGDYLYLCYNKEPCPDAFEIDPQNLPKPGILDIKVVGAKNEEDAMKLKPEGFTMHPLDLNKGAGGDYIYLCYKEGEYDAQKIVKNIVVVGGNSEFIEAPVGYEKDGYNLNRNTRTKGEYIYLCFKR